MHQGTEEVGQRGFPGRHGQMHLARDDVIVVVAPGIGEVAHEAVEHEHRRLKAVLVLDEIGHGVRAGFAHPIQIRNRVGVSRPPLAAMTARQRGVQQSFRRGPRPEEVPHVLAAHRVNLSHSGFAARPPLGHALGRFQAVNVVGIDSPVTDADTFPQRRPEGHVDGRNPPGDRQGRSREEWKSETTAVRHHVDALVPVGGQVFVVEHGNRPAALLEHVDHLLEKPVSRIQFLALAVPRIIAVFGDDQHGVHVEFSRSARQSFGDGWIDARVVPALPVPAQIIVGKLVHIQRH